MAEAPPSDAQSLAESWSLPKEATENVSPVEASHDENPKDATSEEVASDSVDAQLSIEKTDETTAKNEDVTPEAADDGQTDDKIDEATDDSPTDDKINDLSLEENANEKSSTEEDSEVHEEEQQPEEVVEEKPVIKVETAPADFRFPTTNQTRHCFTRYVEYHRCIQAKGEGAPECDKFARYYRSLCPSEWVERWNEQRENGTFPGPL